MRQVISAALDQAEAALRQLKSDTGALASVEAAAAAMVAAFKAGGRVFSCGNGGSMCDAMHLAEELSGRFRNDRPPLPAIAISDPGHMSCVGNDYGYEQVFARFLQAHATPRDVLVAISTSGTSRNVILAARVARERGAKVIALTGRPGAELERLADHTICTQADTLYADRVQELHIKVIHILIELCERELELTGK
jgi:D-sedoheptulose 7-phosphate isomerase